MQAHKNEPRGDTTGGTQPFDGEKNRRRKSPLKKILVFREALPPLEGTSVSVCEWARSVALGLEREPNYWVPRHVLEETQDDNGCHDGERIVRHLYHVVKDHLTTLEEKEGRRWIGAEYWAQVYTGGRGLAFHVDKDEHAMKHRREMINPLYSSVLYLTGESSLQSPTVITDEHYDEDMQRMVPMDFPTESALVFPMENRYCVFDGRCGHGVLDTNTAASLKGNDTDVRITFLVNWWDVKPEAVEQCPGRHVAAESAGTRCGAPVRFDNDINLGARREPIVTLRVTKEYLFGNEPFMMDDFLQSHGIFNAESVWEEMSRPVVVIHHSGIVIIPSGQQWVNDNDDGDTNTNDLRKYLIDAALISSENQSLFMS